MIQVGGHAPVLAEFGGNGDKSPRSLALSTLTACGFLVAYDQAAHWFLIPLVLWRDRDRVDAVDWFRGA